MRLKIKSTEDFWAGLIFFGIGLYAIYLAWDYPMGSALRMGPGYFPTSLGAILSAFGLAIIALSFRLELENPAHVPWAFRPWLVLCGTLVVYGLMMRFELGFVPSLMTLIIGCSLAHRDVHLLETALLSVFLTAACVGVFIYGLGLPFRLFWWSY
ncbi:tripartite tricarboxylate transporter TctB family protein [Chelativorans alearense]|uniref:tripartite tricarboxylate transporter TctB family protein n=1 Tax=Chelativorans alearense TaxID=2681495 RepID=UPI0013D4D4F9|nr:tripartite tricarboxylate transporter TctB family protein [Chelativorans alearense]